MAKSNTTLAMTVETKLNQALFRLSEDAFQMPDFAVAAKELNFKNILLKEELTRIKQDNQSQELQLKEKNQEVELLKTMVNRRKDKSKTQMQVMIYYILLNNSGTVNDAQTPFLHSKI